MLKKLLTMSFHASTCIPNFRKEITEGATGQQNMLNPPWHLTSPLSGVCIVIHSTLYSVFMITFNILLDLPVYSPQNTVQRNNHITKKNNVSGYICWRINFIVKLIISRYMNMLLNSKSLKVTLPQNLLRETNEAFREISHIHPLIWNNV
jgi:hypothetical protein